MNLLDRMARLVRADAHGVVEALEDRGLLLRQHLRDAEAEVLGSARASGPSRWKPDASARRRSAGRIASPPWTKT